MGKRFYLGVTMASMGPSPRLPSALWVPGPAAGDAVRVAEARCGSSRAWLVEVSAGARFVAAAPGPSRTTAQFAADAATLAAINGGLFDGCKRPGEGTCCWWSQQR